MNEIDWSKAPEGATHYVVGSIHPFEKRVGDDWFYYAGGMWSRVYSKGDDRIASSSLAVVPRPTAPSWSGEGVPAVGATLEVTDKTLNDGVWTKVVILAVGKHGKDDCVLMAEVLDDKGRPGTMVASLYTQYEGYFRPIRTPEQIAADEREAAIDEMLAATPAPGSDISLRVCEQLYDAGYRKP